MIRYEESEECIPHPTESKRRPKEEDVIALEQGEVEEAESEYFGHSTRNIYDASECSYKPNTSTNPGNEVPAPNFKCASKTSKRNDDKNY
ncbi:hypothetical protein Cni_G26062 [Canna indica]|uniref:Uncharacterized protein n=1 Tax=Canna indica TaxID=4628 RepID=A0AAQ3L287_9LILI|nr:hypothetical protein Cni_G26062 [Canna indica]